MQQSTMHEPAMSQLSLVEKIGYACGDAAANLVWRGALAYLAVFYTDTFGLAASATALLFLIVRLSDGVTDIIMGMIADRTETRWGKFRPWVLWSTPLLGLFMILCFTTPDLNQQNKLIYAYVTYLGLTLAYTLNNVPYSALMGVMTSNDLERTGLSGFRFAGAFIGGLFVMGFLPELVAFFGSIDSQTAGAVNEAQGYQYSMYVFAALLVILMLITFFTTRERVTPAQQHAGSLRSELADLSKHLPFIMIPLGAMSAFFYYRDLLTGGIFVVVIVVAYYLIQRLTKLDRNTLPDSKRDIVDLLTNKPWLILLGIGFLTMMFNGIKYGVIAYYFKYYIQDELMAGQYFVALLVVSVLGALTTRYFVSKIGRRALFIVSLIAGSAFTCCLYFIPSHNVEMVFVLGCIAEFFAAMMPTLFFSMLGDSADYSEWKNGRRATGLVYSAGTFVQKTGGGFAGALVLLVLAQYGYDGMDADTIAGAIPGMLLLMSFIPAAFGFAGAVLMVFYPLTENFCAQISQTLSDRRSKDGVTSQQI